MNCLNLLLHYKCDVVAISGTELLVAILNGT